MTAVLIPAASEQEWLEARRTGITASEIAVVMGLSPYSSPFSLYHQKLGNLPPMEDSLVLRVGRHNESLACELFAERNLELDLHGDGRQLYAHPDRPWQMATPDRLVTEAGAYVCPLHDRLDFDPVDGAPCHCGGPLLAVLEAKTAASYDGWGDDGSDEIPVHYRCQVLWQMDVMGVSTAFVACLFLHSRQLRAYEITLDAAAKDDLLLMQGEALMFLDRLRGGREPDVDWRPATIDALKALHPDVEDTEIPVSPQLAARYHAACRNARHWEQRKKNYEAHLRERMGSARRAVDLRTGEVIARRDVYDVREHVRKAATVDKVVPVYPKEAK